MANAILSTRHRRCLGNRYRKVVDDDCSLSLFFRWLTRQMTLTRLCELWDYLPGYVSTFQQSNRSTAMHQEKTILLVEDNSIIKNFTRKCFERFGCHVTVVGTKAEAIQQVSTLLFSLLLMDIGLPDGSGWEVIETTREDEQSQNPTTPIVIISAHVNAEQEREKCQHWKVNRIIEKPLQIEDMHIILTLLNNTNNDSFTVV